MKKIQKKIFYYFLPFVSAAILLAVYFLWPNYKKNTTTMVYPCVIICLLVCYMVLLLLSVRFESVRSFCARQVPWFTAIFLLLTAIDLLTLKSGILGMPMFPWPDRLLNEMITDRRELLDCAANSLRLLFTGYFWGLLLAIVTGVAAGSSARARYWISPILRVIGPIPAVTWMALFFVLAPSLFVGCVTMVAYSVWHPVATGIMNGILQVDRAYGESAKMLGVRSSGSMILHVTIPLVMPNLFQGLVSGMRAACGSLVIAEMMGVESGLAWYMTWQRGWGNFTKMHTAIICIAVTFLAVDLLLSIIRKRVLKWQEVSK